MTAEWVGFTTDSVVNTWDERRDRGWEGAARCFTRQGVTRDSIHALPCSARAISSD
jgi:hypothetical protein